MPKRPHSDSGRLKRQRLSGDASEIVESEYKSHPPMLLLARRKKKRWGLFFMNQGNRKRRTTDFPT
jgi:hypothetical protein